KESDRPVLELHLRDYQLCIDVRIVIQLWPLRYHIRSAIVYLTGNDTRLAFESGMTISRNLSRFTIPPQILERNIGKRFVNRDSRNMRPPCC
ncbi:MAG: hypothetical protein ABIR84_03500, partial [Candidatus Nitrotoga sp.]